jgi:hypothetical protein
MERLSRHTGTSQGLHETLTRLAINPIFGFVDQLLGFRDCGETNVFYKVNTRALCRSPDDRW